MNKKTPLDATRKMSDLALLWGKALPAVSAFIRSAVQDYHDSEDVTQATVHYIARHFDEYDPARPFVAWAIGIARYRVLEHRHQKGRSPALLGERALESLSEAFIDVSPEMDARREALEHCLGLLKKRHQAVVRQRYFEGASREDIAERLGVKANTVSVTLRRVRESLARCIDERMQSEDA